MIKTKRIKIFVDAHSFDTEFQGAQTFLRGLYTPLLEQDTIDIYFGTYDADNLKAAFPGLDPDRILIYKKRKLSIGRLLFDIPEILKNMRFDFAHFQYMSPAPVKNCKYIVTMHDVLFNDFGSLFSWQYRFSRNFLFGRSIKKAALKTTVSAYSAGRISRHYDIPEKQLHIIPNGISSAFGNHLSAARARELVWEKYGIRNFILFVSRIEPRKNHLLLLDKFLELELYRQNISLVFIGHLSLEVPCLQKRIDMLTQEQRSFFHLISQVGQQDLEAFYKSCRLFVYPSSAEGFGIPPLEAAVCKVPVLCSNTTAMNDFSFFNPFTFDPANAHEFKYKLKAMIESGLPNNQLDKIAAAVVKKYSWENSAAGFYKLIQQNYQPWE